MMACVAVGWLHVFWAPYTKVEESFNLHAIHDNIFHGPLALPNYDHFVFPGVVPRSFIGNLVLSLATATAAVVSKILHPLKSKYELQVLARLTLASLNALGLHQLQSAVSRRFGRQVSGMFVLLTCTQFHIPFWMGRTLPNMFALYFVNVAAALIIARPATYEERRKKFDVAIALLTFSAVTLRSELVLLLGPLVLQGLYLRRTSLLAVIKTGLLSGMLSLALTVSVDSYFWKQWPLWPEFSALYFNVYEGKSSEWGTSPPYSYFTTHLPKLLMSALPLSIVGLLVDKRMQRVLLPWFVFVALLSCLGHKEWRFIVYVVPIWNIVGARGAVWLMSARLNSTYVVISRGFYKLVLLGLICLNVLATVLMTQASAVNYPGGEALRTFNSILERSGEQGGRQVSVHIDNFAAQTGASLFIHEHAPPTSPLVSRSLSLNVYYNKTENLVAPQDFQGFDWIITEKPDVFLLGLGGSAAQWSVEASIDGLKGVELRSIGGQGLWRKIKVPQVVQEPRLWLLKQMHS
ncbi:glycosyltransferase family 22 protein [Ramaria rubella]|nr:glycosyltransferase family 22 protein [Ramaria rubella]